MYRLGLLLALVLTPPLVAQSCDMGGFTLADFTDHVVVTNASPTQNAFVIFTTTQSQTEIALRPGQSRTVDSLVAAQYTASVIALGPGWRTYQDRLTELRDDLEELSLNPSQTTLAPADIVGELAQVESALEELQSAPGRDTPPIPTCSRPIHSGVDGHVTVAWHTVSNVGGYWALSCS